MNSPYSIVILTVSQRNPEKTVEEHKNKVREAFDVLNKLKLPAKLDMYQIAKSETLWFEFDISQDGIEPHNCNGITLTITDPDSIYV